MPNINKEVMKVAPALISAAKTANFTGLTIDTLGFGELTFACLTATVTDGTTTMGAEYSDDGGSNWSTVPAAEIVGSAKFDTTASDDNAAKRYGVLIRHRHYRCTGTVAGATTGLVIGVVAILTEPANAPVLP